MRLVEAQKVWVGISGVSGGIGTALQNAEGKGYSIMRSVIAEVLIAVVTFGWSFSSEADSQDAAAVHQSAYSTSVQENKAGALSGGAAGIDAEAGKSAGNDALEPVGQYAHEEGKAYYLDLQVIRNSPEEIEMLRKSAEQGTRSRRITLA